MEERKLNFLEEIIEKDLAEGKVDSIMTRFPPEPNGYLHLGHAKSICLNFGLAQKYRVRGLHQGGHQVAGLPVG